MDVMIATGLEGTPGAMTVTGLEGIPGAMTVTGPLMTVTVLEINRVAMAETLLLDQEAMETTRAEDRVTAITPLVDPDMVTIVAVIKV